MDVQSTLHANSPSLQLRAGVLGRCPRGSGGTNGTKRCVVRIVRMADGGSPGVGPVRLAPRARTRPDELMPRRSPLRDPDDALSVGAASRGRRAAAGLAGRRRARPPVRGRWARALPGRRVRTRRPARPARRRPRLHDRRPPRRGQGAGQGLGRLAVGDRDRVRHRRPAEGRLPARGHDLPQRVLSLGVAQPGGDVRDVARGRPGPPRLHRQRDGRVGARRTGSSTRTAACPTWLVAVLRTPGPAGGLVRRRPAADAAGGPVRRRSWASRWRREVVAAMTVDVRPAGDHHRRAGAGRAVQADARRRRRGAVSSCWSRPAWPSWCCPSCRGWPCRSTPSTTTRTSTSTRSPCSRTRSGWSRRGRTWCCGWRRCCTTSASPRPAGSRLPAGSRSTTTRWSAPRWPASGSGLLKYSARRRRTRSASWSSCTCASTATAAASGPTLRCGATSATPATGARPAAPAGPQRLHDAQQAQGGGPVSGVRRARGADRGARRAGGAVGDPARSRRQRDHGAARADAGPAGRAGPTTRCSSCGWSAGRCPTTRRLRRCARGLRPRALKSASAR